ncbi:MAG: phosphate ABC transporter permease PstA [Caldisericia bacterium]|jgi:phosphate transport system permease protein|nr:phosphate ABC transporter permease PstA [Caldisericia bacterium]
MNKLDYINKKRVIKDKIFKKFVTILTFISIIPLFLIIYFVSIRGFRYLSLRFITSLPKPMGEAGGGIFNAIIGSFIIVGIAALISIPIGIIVGVFLSEYKETKFSEVVKILIDTLQGIPSIVIGIIGYIWIVKPLKHFSAISGSIALAIMMLPIIIKSTEEILNMVPQEIKEGAIALGAPYYRVVLKILLPYGFVGIFTGILLGISRIMGETAPLLFTAFGNQFLNLNIFKPMSTIPYVIFVYATSPYKEWHNQAFAASIILIIIVLSINLIGRALEKKWKM